MSPKLARRLAEVAATEPNVEVRCQLACSARRLPAKDCLPIIRELLAHSQDTNDVYMPLSLWWAIESKCEENRNVVLDVFRDKAVWSFDLVRDHIIQRTMRRFAQAGKQKDLLTCAALLELAPTPDDAKRLLAGFEKAFEGRSLGALPKPLLAAIAKAGGGSLGLRLRQADPKAIDEALKAIPNSKISRNQRVQFIDILGQIKEKRCVPVLLRLTETSRDEEIRSAALATLQSFDEVAIAKKVVTLHNGFSADVRQVAHSMLASRLDWSLELLKAIDDGRIKADAIPLPVVRKILVHRDKRIASLVDKHWGAVQGATTDEMLQDIKRYSKVIGSASGNPYSGEKLFGQSCGKCHVLFAQGGFVGPNLTAYKRDDLRRMLLNVVNPSIEIREGYEQYAIITLDGRVLTGFISEQDNRVVVLRSTDGRSTVIPRDNIDEMRAVSQSVMPEGILKAFSDQQIRDLFAYLRASQPLP